MVTVHSWICIVSGAKDIGMSRVALGCRGIEVGFLRRRQKVESFGLASWSRNVLKRQPGRSKNENATLTDT